jgi:hypothetical protein
VLTGMGTKKVAKLIMTRQNWAANLGHLKSRIGQYRPLMPRWSCSSRLFEDVTVWPAMQGEEPNIASTFNSAGWLFFSL